MLDDEGVAAEAVSNTRALHGVLAERAWPASLALRQDHVARDPERVGSAPIFYARSFAQHGHGRSRPLTRRPIVASHEHTVAAVALGGLLGGPVHAASCGPRSAAFGSMVAGCQERRGNMVDMFTSVVGPNRGPRVHPGAPGTG